MADQVREARQAAARECRLRLHRLFLESFFYSRDIRPVGGAFVKRKTFVDSDEPHALPARSLEVEVRVGQLEFPDKAESRVLRLICSQ